MRELTFCAKDRLEWRERPAPRIERPEQALVRPIAVSRCDLDRAIVAGRFPMEGPFAVGHECVARVLEVGDGVRGSEPGDRVVVPFQISCGACDYCARCLTGSCRSVPPLSAFGLGPLSGREWGGALSDAMLVPFADAMLVPLPEGVPPWVAAGASDNIADGYRSVAEPLEALPGAEVLVVGGGAPRVGLFAVACARALGASEVTYVDASTPRLTLAERLGARVVERSPEAGEPVGRFPITVDASARPEGLRLAIASTADEGTCTSVGIYPRDVPLPLFAMYTRGIRFLTGRAQSRALLPEVLSLLSDGTLQTLGARRVAWDEAADAWRSTATQLVVEREQ